MKSPGRIGRRAGQVAGRDLQKRTTSKRITIDPSLPMTTKDMLRRPGGRHTGIRRYARPENQPGKRDGQLTAGIAEPANGGMSSFLNRLHAAKAQYAGRLQLSDKDRIIQDMADGSDLRVET